MPHRPVIRVKNLVKDFDQGKTTNHVLKGINLEILPGEYIILFGPSGCGKSTLVNILAGLETITSGRVYLRDEDISKLSGDEVSQLHRTKIGMIFQQFNLIKSLNVLDNVTLPQVAAGVGRRRRNKRALGILEDFGLARYARLLPTELSGGQQQKVATARALVNNPWILIADEPTGNLDSKSADEIMELLKDLNEKGKRTIILITHNPDYIYFPHRVLYMKDGLITKEVVNRKRYAAEVDALNIPDYLSHHPDIPPTLHDAWSRVADLVKEFKLDRLSQGRLERLANTLSEVLSGARSREDFILLLHRNFREGGVGLRKKAADKLADKILDAASLPRDGSASGENMFSAFAQAPSGAHNDLTQKTITTDRNEKTS